jgi:hypothetical protein
MCEHTRHAAHLSGRVEACLTATLRVHIRLVRNSAGTALRLAIVVAGRAATRVAHRYLVIAANLHSTQ